MVVKTVEQQSCKISVRFFMSLFFQRDVWRFLEFEDYYRISIACCGKIPV